MNRKDKHAVAKTALQIAWLWNEKAKDNSREVFKDAGSKQSLRDALTAMRVNGLIEDFWILPPRVQMGGEVLCFGANGLIEVYRK